MKLKPYSTGRNTAPEEPVEVGGHATLADSSGTLPATALGLPSGEERYQMQRRLGNGAMGEVFAAKDLFLRRRVAFKRMNLAVASSPQLATRFLNEAQITAQLEHPNIIPIYGLESTREGTVAYAMKFIEGRNLTQLLTEARDTCSKSPPLHEAQRLAERLRIFTRICDAMAYAHAKGVLHRDLKPDNVMIGHFNQVYVVDWGICRIANQEEQKILPLPGTDGTDGADPVSSTPGGTQVGSLLGTPGYMSPEQALGEHEKLDERSDLYALGLILFELVALRPALEGNSVQALVMKSALSKKEPLAHIDPRIAIAEELRAIISKATAHRPQDRYRNVLEMTADLNSYSNGDAIQALPDSLVRKSMRLLGRHRRATLVVLLLLFVVGIGGILGLQLHTALQTAAERQRRQKLQQLMLAVAQHSHLIDNRIHENEALLYGLAGYAEPYLLRHVGRDEADTRIFFNQDFATAKRAPPDLADDPRYGQKISMSWPVFKLAPGETTAALHDDIQAAAALAPSMRAMYGARASMLYRIFVTLASGVHMAYPGRGGFPADYDGRLRPKYRLAVGQHTLRWGNAYLDLFGEALLPCSFPLYDAAGQLVAVVGFDLLLSEMAERLLPLSQSPHIEQVFLVDKEARVLLQWPYQKEAAATKSPAVGQLHDNATLTLQPLPFPAVVEGLRADLNGGYRELDGQVVAFAPLSAMGCSLVVVANAATLP